MLQLSVLRGEKRMPTSNKDCFSDACVRHRKDAEILLGEKRYDNAMHLFGFAVECALKTLVDKPQDYRHSIESLSSKVLVPFAITNPKLCLQIGAVPIKLSDGHPERRYWSDGYFSEQDVEEAKIYANQIFDILLNEHLKSIPNFQEEEEKA